MNDYRKKAELLMKLGDAEIAEKRRRTAIIRRTVGGVCGLCAAAAIGLGVWNSTALKGALTPDPDHGYADVTETHPTTETTTAPTTATSSTTQPTSTAPPTTSTTETTAAPETHTTITPTTTAVQTTTPELTAATTTTETKITPESPTIPVNTPERWEDLPINKRFSRFEAVSNMEISSPPKEVYTSTGETMSEENIVRFIGMTKLTAVDPDTGITHETTAERFCTRYDNLCALRFPDDENYYVYELTNSIT